MEKIGNNKYWYCFLAACAFAMMTKWLAAIYLLPIIVLFAYESYKRFRRKELTSRSLVIGAALFFGITAPWYSANLGFILKETHNTILPESSDPQQLWSGANFFFYIYQFITFQVTIFFVPLALLGGFFLARSSSTKRYFILSYILFLYLVFTLVPNKDPRYTMPILIFISILIAYCFVQLMRFSKILGIILTAVFIGYIIVLFSFLSFRAPTFHFQRAKQLPLVGWVDYINLNDNSAHAPDNDSWPQKQIHEVITADAQRKEVKVLMLIDQERFNLGNFLIDRETNKFWNVLTLPAPLTLDQTEEAAKRTLKEYNYVIIAKEHVGVSATRNIAVLEYLTNFIQLHSVDWLIKIASFKTPNKDTITVYKVSL